MARPKATPQDIRERKVRARVWREFRRIHLFTQSRLAETVGISRRTVQQIEGGRITPYAETLRLFEVIKKKHERKRNV